MRSLIGIAYRILRVYWRIFHPKTMGVRVLVHDDANNVMLVRHTYGSDKWMFPGGSIKRGETFPSAAVREVNEEVGVKIDASSEALKLLGVYSSFRHGKSDHIVVFTVEDPRSGKPSSPEISDCRSFPAEDLPPDTSNATKRRIAEWLGYKKVSFDW